ncbi:MAG: hypothetical protein A2070_09710 [Bdellovibrionales bacterium GWC1_52_8]|nr:MAG: hypothetical protein A2X97_12955 [Bdellovibrionales bacterium GWA1_52_35]OFZ42683.1 MAG: hypothetical protein A2070_09710 [Bdellovibrionales bacterium GWC1_52_8]HCM39933.1 hypothetical protein [Bdellovibrionales bacterium]
MLIAGLLSAENAQADACPWVGASVTVNSQSLAAGDYDCSTQDITIAGGQTLTVLGNTGSTNGTGVLIRAASMTINGSINGDGTGFLGGTGGCGNEAGGGPGAGIIYGTGAGHGGDGAPSNQSATYGAAYGSLTQPTELGSGGAGYCGGAGGNGGGAIKLIVPGTLVVNGSISANGISAVAFYTGGGAGGSIWIEAGTFSGSGPISAKGGGGQAGGSGGGGGGRIAIYFTEKTYTGNVSVVALSGGAATGKAGTVYQKSNGNLFCDSPGTYSLTDVEVGALNGLTVDNGCNLTITGNLSVAGNITVGPSAAAILKLTGTITATDVTINNGSTVSIHSDLTANLLSVQGNSTLIPVGNTGSTNGTGSLLNVTTVTIATGSSIDGTGKGFSGGSAGVCAGETGCGPGGGPPYGVGGGHGGKGTRSGNIPANGATYGSITQPVELGSGGAGYTTFVGGHGGGAVKITATTLTVNGSILMNGGNSNGYYAGGGAGGSIWINVGTLAGSGNIFAKGGTGDGGGAGGGGGGRIAIYYISKSFSGSVNVTGQTVAGSYGPGESGTVFEKSNGSVSCLVAGAVTYSSADLGTVNNLSVDNGCDLTITGNLVVSGPISIGASVPSFLKLTGTVTATDVTVNNASTLTLYSDLTGNVLSILGNSTLVPIGNTSSINGTGSILNMASVDIAAGSSINGNGRGFVGGGAGVCADVVGCGPGGGPVYGTGAGHGGNGARSSQSASYGGSYGSLTQPVELGSGGASYSTFVGGAGGGAIKLVVVNTLTLNGSISMDGTTGNNSYTGGGAGGSIWIDAGTFAGAGTGVLSVRGGAGEASSGGSGGGGGGRIALYYFNKTFSGSVVYTGTAGGYAAGDIGTLYEAQVGKYISQTIDFGSSVLSYQTLAYSVNTPGTSNISVEARSGNTSSPDGTWTSWTTFASGDSLAAFTGNRYLQYRATLSTSDANKPSLDSITINAPACYSTGSYYYVKTTNANKFLSARSNTVSNAAITSSVPANTALKALVSFDGGTTWKKHNSSTWVDAAGGVSTIGTTGNTMAELIAGLNGYTFGASEPTVDFAFGLESDSCSATPSVTELRFDY